MQDKKNIYLAQPQYAMNIRGKPQYWLPYSCGCLWAYAKNQPGISDTWEAHFIFKRNNIVDTLAEIDNPRAMGFSCYVWNEQYNLAIARAVKEKYPNCFIFFGGPNTNEKLLKDHDFIDSVILGEGEKVFYEILETINSGETPKTLYQGMRIADLSELASPYLEGVFDNIIAANPDAYWQCVLETNRGCPFSCTFCDWGSLTMAKVKQFVMDRVMGELNWIADNRVTYLMCADANFGIFKQRDVEIAKIMRECFERSEYFEMANIQYYKNANDHILDIAQIIGPYQKGLTVSVQSMHDETLIAIERSNMRINDIQSLMEEADKRNIFTYSELILGMPLETIESWKTGINDLLEQGQHNCIDVWFGQLLKNSEMNSLEYKEKYGIESVRVKDYYLTYDENDTISEYIDIINKTNTMTTDEIVDAFVYSFMIIRFHIAGYTNIFSRYARSRNVNYKTYYNRLYDVLQKTPTFKEKFEELRESTKKYLLADAGESEENLQSVNIKHSVTNTKSVKTSLQVSSGHYNVVNKKKVKKDDNPKSKHAWLYMRDIDFVYNVREEVFNIGFNILREFLPDTPHNIKNAQVDSIINPDIEYPIYREYNLDVTDFSHTDIPKNYILSDNKKNMGEISFQDRRKGSQVKTIIQELEAEKANGEEIKLAGE